MLPDVVLSHNLTSRKREKPHSCLLSSAHGFLPQLRWHAGGAVWGLSVWDHSQAAICSQAASCSACPHILGRHHRHVTTLACHCFCVQRLSFFKAAWLLTSIPQGLTQNPGHFRSSLNVTPSFQPTSRAERDCKAARLWYKVHGSKDKEPKEISAF